MTNQIDASQRAIEAALRFRGALNELRELTGEELTGNQAQKYSDNLLRVITQVAQLAPAPLLLTAPEGTKAPSSMVEYMMVVLGDQTMKVEQIATALQDRGWLPPSPRPVHYVSDVLSRNSQGKGENRFIRTARGTYKVAKTRPKMVYRPRP